MIGTELDYIRAYSEVHCLLKHLPQSYIDKLPQKLLEQIEKQSSEEYFLNIDKTKSILKQNFSQKTKDLLAVIKYNYWSTDEEKKQLNNIFFENEKKYQAHLQEKYNTTNIFENKKNSFQNTNTTSTIETSLIKYKEKNFIQNLFDKIKYIFIKK